MRNTSKDIEDQNRLNSLLRRSFSEHCQTLILSSKFIHIFLHSIFYYSIIFLKNGFQQQILNKINLNLCKLVPKINPFDSDAYKSRNSYKSQNSRVKSVKSCKITEAHHVVGSDKTRKIAKIC